MMRAMFRAKVKAGKIIGYVVICLVLLMHAFPAMAEERVLSYQVTASLQKDASMVITERIKVNIEQKQFRHGIYRAIPVKHVLDDLGLLHYDVELISVKLDGRNAPYYQETVGLYNAVAIGREGVGAPLGTHTYELAYKTRGIVMDMADRDEIYYNVTGNDWPVPIDTASFTLELPDNAEFIEAVAYTGFLSESGRDYEVESNTIRTTRVLQAGEGFTVAFAWPKGLVSLPDESWADTMGVNRPLVLWGIMAVMLLYFVAARYLFGRKPKGVVVPIFSAPSGMSPGYMASLKAMAYKGRMLHADIIWAAVNGFLRLDARNKKSILLQKQPLANEEKTKDKRSWVMESCQALTQTLFGTSWQDVDLLSAHGRQRALSAFEYLEKKYRKQQKNLWKRSYIPGVCGLALLIALFIWAMQYIYSPMLEVDYGGATMYLVIVGTMFFIIGISVYGIRQALSGVINGGRRVLVLVLAPVMGLSVLAAVLAISANDYFFLFILVASFALPLWLILNPPGRFSAQGAKKYNMVQGLEMYIRTAETNRLAKLNAPEDTIEKFEELLPYAVALNAASAWQKRFDKLLLESDYVPAWAGSDNGAQHFRQIFVTITAASALSTISSASARAAHSARLARVSGGGGSGGTRPSGFRGGSSGGGSSGGSGGAW